MKASSLQARTHQCTATVEVFDDATQARVKTELTLVYNTSSPTAAKGINRAMTLNPQSSGESDKYTIDLALYCAAVVLEIKELTNDDGTPFTLTDEYWQTLDVGHIKAIYEAIQEDERPDPLSPAASLTP